MRHHARKFFNKLNTLNAVLLDPDGDANEKQGARKALRRIPDSWSKRQNNNAGSFWKKQNDIS